MSVTLATSHDHKPFPVNLDAPKNVPSSVTTFPTFHPVRSAFISLASRKVRDREVAEAVSHLLMAVPTNVAALELPFHANDPPAWFRCFEKAWLKSFTPLTSKSPMSPHLVVAVLMFWT